MTTTLVIIDETLQQKWMDYDKTVNTLMKLLTRYDRAPYDIFSLSLLRQWGTDYGLVREIIPSWFLSLRAEL